MKHRKLVITIAVLALAAICVAAYVIGHQVRLQKAAAYSFVVDQVYGAALLHAEVTYTTEEGTFTATGNSLLSKLGQGFDIYINNPPIVESINFDTTEAILYTSGFLAAISELEANDATGYRLTPDELYQILCNGNNGSSRFYTPLDSSLSGGLSAEEQLKIVGYFEAYKSGRGDMHGKHKEYVNDLSRFYQEDSVMAKLEEKFGKDYPGFDKLSIDSPRMPLEILQEVLDMYEKAK